MTFEVIDRLNDDQIEDLYRLYQAEWWSKERKKADIERMLKHSDLIVAFCDPNSKRLLAFSRILTDYVYRATIFDVIVGASYRGNGLGRILIDIIANHPKLKSVEGLYLYCLPEMIPFYKKWGFTDDVGNRCLMKKIHL
ncbi:MAG: GNAT family N-acetyltransferase [Hydrococcus sp. Prado102]|jgi:predicted GNAT family N-acyltransferase|nr:GNAT family N-acetyltransferase [Hydrococcus sp. Prado102]